MALSVGRSFVTPVKMNNLNINIDLFLELADRWLLQFAGVGPHSFR